MRLTSIDRLQGDHQQVLEMADRVMKVLSGRSVKADLERVVFQLLDFGDAVLRPHLAREEACLLSVLREHLADSHAEELDEAALQLQQLREDLLFLREAVELGRNLRGILETTEMALREYVEYEETHLIPFAMRELEGRLMDEVEQRFRAYEKHESTEQLTTTFKLDRDAL